MDQSRLVGLLQGGDQQVMDDAVPEVGGKDLARLGAVGDEADGVARTIGVGA